MGKQLAPSSFEELKTFEPEASAPTSFEELKTFEPDNSSVSVRPAMLSQEEWGKTIASYRDALKKYEESVKVHGASPAVQSEGNNRPESSLNPIERQGRIAELRKTYDAESNATADPVEIARTISAAPKAIAESIITPIIAGAKTFGQGAMEAARPIADFLHNASVPTSQGIVNALTAPEAKEAPGKLARGLTDIAIGTLGTGINAMPPMMALNAVNSAAKPVISELVTKAGGGEKEQELANTIFDYAVALKAFGLPVVTGMATGSLFGKLAEEGVRTTDDFLKLKDEDKKRIVELAHNIGFFAGIPLPEVAGKIGNRVAAPFAESAIKQMPSSEQPSADGVFVGRDDTRTARANEPMKREAQARVDNMATGAVIPESSIPIIGGAKDQTPGVVSAERQSAEADLRDSAVRDLRRNSPAMRESEAQIQTDAVLSGQRQSPILAPNGLPFDNFSNRPSAEPLQRTFENDALVSRKVELGEPLSLNEQLYADRNGITEQSPDKALFQPDGKINEQKLAETLKTAQEQNALPETLGALQDEAAQRGNGEELASAIEKSAEINAERSTSADVQQNRTEQKNEQTSPSKDRIVEPTSEAKVSGVSKNEPPYIPEGVNPPKSTPKSFEEEKSAKEPWQMTEREYLATSKRYNSIQSELDKIAEQNLDKKLSSTRARRTTLDARHSRIAEERNRIRTALSKEHEELVRSAVSEGKLVPNNVLAEYPDIAKTQFDPKTAPKSELLSRLVRSKNADETAMLQKEIESREKKEYSDQAKELGITFDGMQKRSGQDALPQFTDPKTGTTFYKQSNETLSEALKRKRDQFEQSNNANGKSVGELFAEGRANAEKTVQKDGTEDFHTFTAAIAHILESKGFKSEGRWDLSNEVHNLFLGNIEYSGIQSLKLFDQVQSAMVRGLSADVEKAGKETAYGDRSDVKRMRFDFYQRDDAEHMGITLKNKIIPKADNVRATADQYGRKADIIEALAGKNEASDKAREFAKEIRAQADEYVRTAKEALADRKQTEQQAADDLKKRIEGNRTLFEGELPKPPNKSDLIPSSEVPKGEINVRPIPENVRPFPNTEEGILKAMATVPSAKGEGKGLTEGIFVDANKKRIIATDGHQLVSIPFDAKESKIVNSDGTPNMQENGPMTPERYVPVDRVIPDDLVSNKKGIELSGLLAQVNGVFKATKFVDDGRYSIAIRIKNDNSTRGDGYIYFTPAVMSDALTALAKSGTKVVDMETSVSNERAAIFRDAENKDKFALVMPIRRNAEETTFKTIGDFGAVEKAGKAPTKESPKQVQPDDGKVSFDEAKDQQFAKELYLKYLKGYSEDPQWKQVTEQKREEIRQKLRKNAIASSNQLLGYIEQKDYVELAKSLHKGNPTTRAAFTRITGVRLPDTERGTQQVLKEFTGYQEPAVEPKKNLTPEERIAKMREAKDNSVLDVKVNYRDLGKMMTRRQFVEQMKKEGMTATVVKEKDQAAINRITKEYEQWRRRDDFPWGNSNHPETKKFHEIRDKFKSLDTNPPMKESYRMTSPNGDFYDITRAEYDYFHKLKSHETPKEPLTPQQVKNAEPLTDAKIKEAARAAKEAGNTLKEQKNQLLEDLEGAKAIVDAHISAKIGEEMMKRYADGEKFGVREYTDVLTKDTDEIRKKLEDDGYTIKGNQIITEIPGDGTFYTSMLSLDHYIDKVKKQFPTSLKEAGSSGSSGPKDKSAKQLVEDDAIRSLGSVENAESIYRDAIKNLETAKASGNTKLKEVMAKAVEEARVQRDAAKDFDFAAYKERKAEEKKFNAEFDEAKKLGLSVSEEYHSTGFGQTRAIYDIRHNGETVSSRGDSESAREEIVHLYRQMKRFGVDKPSEALTFAERISDSGKSYNEYVKSLDADMAEAEQGMKPFQKKNGEVKRLNKNDQRIYDASYRAFRDAESEKEDIIRLKSDINNLLKNEGKVKETPERNVMDEESPLLSQSAEQPKPEESAPQSKESKQIEKQKKWFSGKTFYHGTPKSLKVSDLVEGHAPQWGNAIYFATDRTSPHDNFTGESGVTLEVSINPKKPLFTNSKEFDAIEQRLSDKRNALEKEAFALEEEGKIGEARAKEKEARKYDPDAESGYVNVLNDEIRKSGYDVIVDRNHDEYGDEVAVLDKSIISEKNSAPQESAKQPWEMTAAETYNTLDVNKFNQSAKEANPELFNWYEARPYMDSQVKHRNLHEEIVKKALAEGKPVPTEVLAEYPDLKAKETTAEVKAPETPAPSGERAPSFETFSAIEKKLKKDEYTSADELKRDFQFFLDNKDAIIKSIREYLDTDERYKRKRSATKDEIAKNAYSQSLDMFAGAGGDMLSWGMSFNREGYEDSRFAAVKRNVEAITDEKLAKEREKAQKRREEHQAYIGRVRQAVENPQTLEDFRLHREYSKVPLTPEQKDRYEDVYAQDKKAKRRQEEERAAQIDTTAIGEHIIKKDKDTRDNSDLWIVKPSQRLGSDAFNNYAKAMRQAGGYWSRFKGGFIFKEDPTAKLSGEQKIEVKQKVGSDRLREVANNMQSTIDNKLDVNGTRKTNTARRANMADAMEAEGNTLKRTQQTMRNIADGLDGGDVALLDKISARTEVEQLDSILREAKYAYDRDLGAISDENRYNGNIPVEAIRKAEYPRVTLTKSTALKLADALGKTSTTAKQVLKAAKSAKDEYSVDITDFYQRVLNAFERTGQDKYLKDRLEESALDLRRLQKLGIENGSELRAYLREYLKFRATDERDPMANVKKAERDLLGRDIPGYFPTPKPLVERMLDLADIQDGMDILEPSAGKGNIADAVKENYPSSALSVIEPVSSLRDILTMKGHNLAGDDFLSYDGKHDRIVMNPPFENMQDVDHVRHAYDLLKPGGKLVSIMSESPFFRSDKKASEFREWLESVGGTSEKNPEGSFKTSERPTGVNTRTVTIEKPAEPIAPKSDGPGMAALSIGGNLVARAVVNNSNLSDDDKKKLLTLINAASIAGVASVLGKEQLKSALEKVSGLAPTWYLKSRNLVDEAKQSVFTAAQARGLFKEVKADEMKWTGLDDFLRAKEAKGEKVTKEELQKHLEENNVNVQEVTKGTSKREDLYSEYQPEDKSWYVYNKKDEVVDSFPTEKEANDYIQGQTDAKFSQYQLPGGENYRELLLTLPSQGPKFDESKVSIKRDRRSVTQGEYEIYYDGKKLAGPYDDSRDVSTNYMTPDSEIMKTAKSIFESGDVLPDGRVRVENQQGNFRSSHFDEPNILAHVRFNDRTVDGKKILFLEEVQSDWGQKGRQNGFKSEPLTDSEKAEMKTLSAKWMDSQRGLGESLTPEEDARWTELTNRNQDDNRVPDMPFKKDWHEMAFRRMVRYAAENGYDGIAWTPGKVQSDRYNLAKQVQSVSWDVDKDGKYGITATPINAESDFDVTGGRRVDAKELPELIGKDLAQKIVDQSSLKKSGEFNGLDLQVGTKGMSGFYDKMLPDYANKFGKKFGAQVGEADINTNSGETPVTVGTTDGIKTYSKQGWVFRSKETGRRLTKQEAYKEIEDGGSVRAYNEKNITAHILPVTKPMQESALKNGMPLFSLAGATAYAGVDALPVDDDTKKKLKLLFGTLAVAGLSVSMSKDARSLLADLRAGVLKRASAAGWSPEKIEAETRRSVEGFLKSDEAKGFSAEDQRAIREANLSPDFREQAKQFSEVAKRPSPQSPAQSAVSAMVNPLSVDNSSTVAEVEKSLTGDLGKWLNERFQDEKDIISDNLKNIGENSRSFARNLVRATTEAAVNPKFKAVYDQIGDAERESNGRIYDLEMLIRAAKQDLSPEQLDRIAKLRYEENKTEGIYTDSELAKKGFSPREIESINQLRKAQSDVLDISRDLRLKEWNDYLSQLETRYQAANWQETEKGPSKEAEALKKEIADTKETIRKVENYYQDLKDQGYLTLKRRGRYVVVAEDLSKPEGDPNRIQYDHAVSKRGENGQKSIARRFREQGFQNIREYENRTFYSKFKEKLSPAELEILMDDAGVSPYSEEGQKILAEAKKKFATKSYELPRKYTPGYEESMDNLVRGLVTQGEAYNNLYFRKVGKERAMQALVDANIERTDPRLYAFTRRHIDDSFSSPEQNYRLLHSAKKLTYLMQLGLDPMQFVFNGIFQPLMVTRPYFARPEFKLEGNEVNTYFKRGIETAKELIDGTADKEVQDIYRRTVREGVATEVLSKEVADIEAKETGWLANASEKMSYFTKKGEQWTRSQTIAEAYHIGKEKLNLSGDDLYRFIVDAVSNTQGKAGRGEMPDIFRRFGEPGRAAYQFQSYTSLYLENAVLSIKRDLAEGRLSLPVFRKMMITLGIVGGVNAIPSSGIAQYIYSNATGRDIKEDIKKNLGEVGTDLLMYGMTMNPSFSSRIGMLNRIPKQGEGGFFSNLIENNVPAVAEGNQIWDAATHSFRTIIPTDEDVKAGGQRMQHFMKAISTFTPKGIRNILKAASMEREGIKVDGGKKTLVGPSSVSTGDVLRQSIGLTPTVTNDYYRRKELGLKKKPF